MTNLIILPIFIPLLTGAILICLHKKIAVQRIVAVISSLGTLIVSSIIIHKVHQDGIQSLNISSWDAPFGITLVSDMLSAMLVCTTSIMALACLLYSFKSIGNERENYYYYPVFSFLLVGVNGAFMTGDIFNLFVFFEVMLMSSYVLLVLGGTKIQLRESIKYLLVNVISSALFVIAVALLYSVAGTLNMAHISERISAISGYGMPGIVSVIAVMFLIVFGLKGAIFPLFFWMPGSYYAPPAPVLALFGALLTKVGVYSITRTFTLFFYHDGFVFQLLSILAILSIIVGVIGAIAYWDVKKIIIYNIIVAVGAILYGVSVMNPASIKGAVYYLIHDMIIKAALFLLVGNIIAITGSANLKKFSGLISRYPGLGWTFFIAALALAGIPPLSGFVGKLLIIQGGFEGNSFFGAAIVLMSSLLVLFSVMKIFINGFWGKNLTFEGEEKAPVKWLLISPIILVAISALYGLYSEAILPYIGQASDTLLDPQIYIDAVLKE
ncbi:Na+/H+ antiporter subunit D [Neobacillus muris]|uniref:Na+/H+ antiporter subunit D n=1 Tax=Neobacillus muris TaxID=2941334 RepID=UPI00203CCE32|nr:Na+/H+ antiporter subunit D [Neobacillus muris]